MYMAALPIAVRRASIWLGSGDDEYVVKNVDSSNGIQPGGTDGAVEMVIVMGLQRRAWT